MNVMNLRRASKVFLAREPGSGNSLLRFNPKTKMKRPENEVQKEISNKKYENLCYDATYRV